MKVKALLFDIDGTLIFKDSRIDGALETIDFARKNNIGMRFLTNITSKSPDDIASELQALGLPILSDDIDTATTICARYLHSNSHLKCHLIVPDKVLRIFGDINRDDQHPDVVVISDIGSGFNFETLNKAFLMLRGGAELIALQKNLYWFDQDGPKLDCGAFVLGLEAAAKKTALIMGKPSSFFFNSALEKLACKKEEALVVGDDLLTDIAGGMNSGIRTVLVGTGKYADGQTSNSSAKETHFLNNVGELPALLTQLNA